jgi:hypothetical protein
VINNDAWIKHGQTGDSVEEKQNTALNIIIILKT